MGNGRAGGLAGERILCREFEDGASGTDHDLAFEGQLPSEGSTEGRFFYILAHHKRADCTDVHKAKPGQLLRDRRRSTSVGAADVDRAKKDDMGHASVCTDQLPVTSFRPAAAGPLGRRVLSRIIEQKKQRNECCFWDFASFVIVCQNQAECSNFSRPRSGRKYMVAGNAIMTRASGT